MRTLPVSNQSWSIANRRRPGHAAPRLALAGFTLIEVVLAVFITIGMMVIVLYFYSQAANLRTQLILETERISGVRLMLDRLSMELRSARQHAQFQGAFVGQADFLQFIKTDLPPRSSWSGAALGRAESATTDHQLVSYRLGTITEGTNVINGGLVRTEQSLVRTRQVLDISAEPPGAPASDPVAVPAASGADPASDPLAVSPPPLLPDVRYLRFRFWDGTQWQDAWSGTGLPRGVEINLSFETPPEVLSEVVSELATNAFPFEVFRRVVYLPVTSEEEEMFLFELESEPTTPTSPAEETP